MEVSKISFSKKTREKMGEELSVRRKGKILFARLKELDESGVLSKAQTRADVARLAGYPEERAKAGYAWVSNLIRRGHLAETIQEWTPSGKIIAEYHLTGSQPLYNYEEAKQRRAKKEEAIREWEKQQDNMPILEEKKPTNIKIEITRGDITIKVEMEDHEQASKLITTIMKGE